MKAFIKFYLLLLVIGLLTSCMTSNDVKEEAANTKLYEVEDKIDKGEVTTLNDIQLAYLEIEEAMMVSNNKVIERKAAFIAKKLEVIANGIETINDQTSQDILVQEELQPVVDSIRKKLNSIDTTTVKEYLKDMDSTRDER